MSILTLATQSQMQITQVPKWNKFLLSLKTAIIFTAVTLALGSHAYSGEMIYQGKVIDADTLQPIENALVLAVWDEEVATFAGTDLRLGDVKETLTNNYGYWSISGPKGETELMNPYVSLLLGKYYLRDPYFLIYKPGYAKYGGLGGFEAYPYVDLEHNLEGIVLIRPGDTWEEVNRFGKEYSSNGFVPFVPVRDPERKLRDLDFSFKYPENTRKIGTGIRWRVSRPFWVYTVVGIKKVTTREERLESIPYISLNGNRRLPLLSEMIDRERQRLQEVNGSVAK